MALTKGDKEWIEDSSYRILTKFYQKVIASKMATKEDIENIAADVTELKNKMTAVDIRMGSVEAKVSSLEKAVWSVSDHQGKKLDNHEKRISVLEEAA